MNNMPLNDTPRNDKVWQFLEGGGEMGARIRAYDWDHSPLGPPVNWPTGLKMALRILLTTGHPMYVLWGPELIQFYNDAYSRSIGPERHPSSLGTPTRETWKEIWPIIGPQIEKVMAGQGHIWQENQLVPITRYGKLEDAYWTYSYGPIDDPAAANGVGGVLVIATETTAQVQAEQRLKAAEAKWRSLFDQAPAFMVILEGPEHVFTFANPRYFRFVRNRDILGKPVREALPEVDSQGFIALLDRVYRNGEVHLGLSTPIDLVGNDGTREHLYVDFVFQPIRDNDGKVTGIFVNGYEVTDRILANQRLEEQYRRKDEFLAMLAHELRNPLAPIRNVGEILAHVASNDPVVRSMADVITRQANQLTRLVDDLLDVSRLTRGRIELQIGPMNIGDVVQQAVESLASLLAAKQHELIINRCTDALIVNGDQARLIQCFANVLTNAAKYTDPQGRIEVECKKEDEWAIIEISDNGLGIAPEIQPKLFELFVQADRTLDRSQGGMGIGLSLVHQLVKMHGGDVEIFSEGLGEGTKVTIRLPLLAAIPLEKNDEAQTDLAPMRILVVDDNVDAADSLASLLKLHGHETRTLYNSTSALDEATSFKPEAILLDIGLPELDGYELARLLRKRGTTCPLVAVTGYGQAEDVARSKQAGFNAHVTKPVPWTRLKQVLSELH